MMSPSRVEHISRWLRRQQQRCRRAVFSARLAGLWRTTPVSREFGFDRGMPLDRYYIESFLEARRADIHGRVLEIGDSVYTRRFGTNRVVKSDVLHTEEGVQGVTLLGDLATGEGISSDAFDCVILTQTLPFIYDVRSAVRTLYRAVAPGGVVLATTPGISQVSRFDMDRWGDYWRFTSMSARRLFEEVFPARCVTVEAHGNVLSAIAFLHGLAAQELRQNELDYRDPDYEVVITIRAVKPEARC